MAKIIVTGGCGYIGSHTLVSLIESGFDVVSIDNLSNSYETALDGVYKITGKKVNNYNIDLCNKEATLNVFEQHKDAVGVIHFAAKKYVNESVEKPLLYYRNNIDSLANVLEACQKFGVNNFVFSSSCSVYGNAEKLPVDENCPLAKPESPYANTKVIGEQIVNDVVGVSDIKATLLRYFNPAGAHQSGCIGEKPRVQPQNIVPRITGTALGKYEKFSVAGTDYPTRDGTCIRDYIHVSDIANAHVQALNCLLNQQEQTEAEVFNLGTGNGVSVLEMIKAFEKANELKLNYTLEARRSGDVVAIYADNTKAKNILNWNPKITVEQMMKSAYEWDKKNVL